MCVREDVERSINHGKSRLKTAKDYYPLGVLSSGEVRKPDRFFSIFFFFSFWLFVAPLSLTFVR